MCFKQQLPLSYTVALGWLVGFFFKAWRFFLYLLCRRPILLFGWPTLQRNLQCKFCYFVVNIVECITLSTGHLKVEEACQISQVYLAKVRKYEYRIADVEEKKHSVARPSLFGGLDSGLDCGTGLRDWTHRKLRSSNFEAAHTLLHYIILTSHELNSEQTAITRYQYR